jgi:hypothetical protein
MARFERGNAPLVVTHLIGQSPIVDEEIFELADGSAYRDEFGSNAHLRRDLTLVEAVETLDGLVETLDGSIQTNVRLARLVADLDENLSREVCHDAPSVTPRGELRAHQL